MNKPTYNPFETIDARLANLEALTLDVLQHVHTTATTVPEIGGIELAQEITRLSKARIYTLVSERKLPHAKRGNRLSFSRTELLDWVAAGHRGEVITPLTISTRKQDATKKGGTAQ
jgi:predicted DNA-binding transcriptional regulator AlpA